MKHYTTESESPFKDIDSASKSPNIPIAHVGMRQMRALWMPVFVMIALLGGLSATLFFLKTPQDIRNRAASTGPKLSIDPSQKSAKVGESFPMGIYIATGDDTVSAVELHLTYDPAAIGIIGFKEGDKLSTVLVKESHNNGQMSVTLGTPPTSPFKGTAAVGTLTVKILANKASTIAFTSNTQVAAIGKTTNTLAGTSDGKITINTGAASTPTPTPHPGSPTPTPGNRGVAPTPTPGQQTVGQSGFGALTTNTQPLVTNTNHTVTQQNVSQLPTLPGAPTPPSIPPKAPNFLEQIFILIGSFFQRFFIRSGP